MIESAIGSDHASKYHYRPIIEFPASPGPASTESLTGDIEDFSISESLGEIEDFDCESKFQTTILNNNEMSELDYDDFGISESLEDMEDFGRESEFQTLVLNNEDMSELEYDNDDISNVMYALTPQVAQHSVPKLKHVKRIRTEHQV